MISSKQYAIIGKDIRSIVSNKSLLTGLIVVPLMFALVFPLMFTLILYFAPDQLDDIEPLLEILPASMISDDMAKTTFLFLFNAVMPMFFMLIPVLSSTIMAASSFVGEKEKSTLETLLYCPLSLRQIYQAKVWASFFFSTGITILSFLVMLIVMELGALLILESLILPGLSWLFTMLVVSPAVSLLSITFIVMISTKAKSMEDAQQRSVFLIIPILALIIGQFLGVMIVSAWYLLAIGVIFAVIAFIMMKKSTKNLSYEKLLK